MKILLSGALLLASIVGPMSTRAFALQDGAKQDMKDAGKSTEHATKKTAHKVKKTTKQGVNKSAHGVKKGAGKLEDKTE
jgi:hypothetical protein